MIVISAILVNNKFEPSRGFTEEESALTITCERFDGENYIFYTGDEPEYIIPLSEFKQKRCDDIDAKTQSLIGHGFVFDSHNFSLSLNAQSNWTNIKANKQDFINLGLFPISITSAQGEYPLSEANVFSFWLTAMGTVKAHYGSGLVLKNQVNECETAEEVELIIDNR